MTALHRGLALHLDFAGATGGTIADVSGNGRDGVARGDALPVPDATLGRCLRLAGSGRVEVPALGATDAFTLQLWLNADSLGGRRGLYSAADGGVTLSLTENRLRLDVAGQAPATPAQLVFDPVLTPGRWYQVTVGYSSRAGRAMLCLDGGPEQVVPLTTAPAVAAGNVLVGAAVAAGAPFTGRLGGLRVYRRLLTAQEIRRNVALDLARLAVHLPLAVLDGDATPDVSGSAVPARTTGAPTVLPDEVFGRSMRFDGRTQGLRAADSAALRVATYTVSVWLRPDGAPDGEWSGIVGKPGGHRIWLHRTGYVRHRYAAPGDPDAVAPDTAPGSVPGNTWTHVAVTHDGRTVSTYVDGVLAASGPATGTPDPAATPLIVAEDPDDRSGNRFRGALAHVRVHGGALGEDAVRNLMARDQAAATAFRRSHPLAFDLVDAQDEPVLPIDDDATGHQLFVEVTNSADRTVTAEAITGPPTAQTHHLALRFRAGTLAAACLDPARPDRLVRLAADDWRMSAPVVEDRSVVCYLASTVRRTLPAGRTWSLTLEHAVADAADGTRGTRVQLHYRGLTYAGQSTPLTGSRTRMLTITNRLGRARIPLRVGFTGGDTVLNDGGRSESALTLHVANAADRPIPLAPEATDPRRPTRLRIGFDHAPGTRPQPARPWALGTTADLKDVDIPANAAVRGTWRVESSSVEAEATELTLVRTGSAALDRGELIEIPLTRIRSSLPSGSANVHVGYENVPGYQDGQFVCPVRKGPLTTADGRAGIGVTAPQAALHVREQTGTVAGPNGGTVLLDHENGGGASSIVFRSAGNRGSDYGFVQYQDAATAGAAGESARLIVGTANDPDDHVLLQPSGNVGVGPGVTTPKARLHVDGDYYGRGHLFLHAYEGDRADGTAYVQARDDSGRSSLALRLRTQDKGVVREAVHVTAGGSVGIGNNDPRSRLTVHGSTNLSADGAPTGLVTMLIHGSLSSGKATGYRLFDLPARCTAHVEVTALLHDVNSGTNRLSFKAEYVVFREWDRPPRAELLTQVYRHRAGTGTTYDAGLNTRDNEVQAQVSQTGFPTDSVFKLLVRYLLGTT